MVNGSPKTKESCSEFLIEEITKMLENKIDINLCDAKETSAEMYNHIYTSDVMLLVFPLYVDSLPSHLITFLEGLQEYIKERPIKNIQVYAVINCGFYEGHQNKHTLQIVENYCARVGFQWKFGLGIGTGPFLSQSKSMPWKSFIKKPIYESLLLLKASLLGEVKNDKNIYVQANMLRILYKIAGHMGWKTQGKSNQLKVKDLKAK